MRESVTSLHRRWFDDANEWLAAQRKGLSGCCSSLDSSDEGTGVAAVVAAAAEEEQRSTSQYQPVSQTRNASSRRGSIEGSRQSISSQNSASV